MTADCQYYLVHRVMKLSLSVLLNVCLNEGSKRKLEINTIQFGFMSWKGTTDAIFTV